MKMRIAMLIIGIALGAYIGGFLSSQTIEYYNYTRVVASFGPYEDLLGEENISSASVIVPAVDEDGNGVATILEVQIVPGTRKALVDINKLLFWTDTQNSIRVSRSVSENVTGIDLSYFDILYAIHANASVIEGPSAGASMTIATISALRGLEPRRDVMLTGTINHDGTIGPVGDILPKAIAAKQIGAVKMLVPKGQGEQTVYDNREHCFNEYPGRMCTIERVPRLVSISEEAGIDVIEVESITDALDHFYENKENAY